LTLAELVRDLREFFSIAAEALGRYKLRTSLSVLGVILGVAAVIAMMSVSDGARRESLRQVEQLGLDNLVVRNRGLTAAEMTAGRRVGLRASDSEMLAGAVPLVKAASPLVQRFVPVAHAGKGMMGLVLGVGASYQTILRLQLDRGRLLSPLDEQQGARVCVLGSRLAQALFGFHDPIGDNVQVQTEYYKVVGVLRDQGADLRTPGAMAWRDLNQAALVPLATLSGVSLDIDPAMRVDEIWLQAVDGERVEAIGQVLSRTLTSLHRGSMDFDVVIPRELLAQRYRTQQTFSVVVGSVAALALLVGGIGIMNIMLTSVMERTHEIGIRRTVGATRRHVTLQFLSESLLMTLGGGMLGIVAGVGASWGITAYAGWSTHISSAAIALAFGVSLLVGLAFGMYPAIKAAHLEPVDAVRYE
jgi:putative ABC transport system permease protein